MDKIAKMGESFRKKYLNEYMKTKSYFDMGIIGRSILGRDIDYYKIGEGRKNIIVVGAHHALEYMTSYAVYDFIDFIYEKLRERRNYKGINIEFLLKSFSYWLIPCLNPDGVTIHTEGLSGSPLDERIIRMNEGSDFSLWQSNARGVDLNHNYNYGFSEYKKLEAEEGITAGRTRYSGEYPESEPETHSMANLVRSIPCSAVVSLHTQGKEIFFQPCDERSEKITERLKRLTSYEIAKRDRYTSYGGFCDYTGGVLGIPSFTVELGRGKNPLPDVQREEISEDCRKILLFLPMYL